MTVRKFSIIFILATAFGLVSTLMTPGVARAQDRPSQRQLRTYVPPDQLVSFLPSTPFNVFVDFLNPIFERVTGKQIVDPTSGQFAIGISIAGMHFMDALELVLDYHGLTYRETDRYFVVEEAPQQGGVLDAAAARAGGGARAEQTARPATLRTREIEINAILFELNVTKARELGLDWNVFFGQQTSGGGQGGTGGGGGTGSGGVQQARFRLRTDRIFDEFDEYIDAPDQIDFTQLTQFFRLLENEGLGETIANPQITVQSGEQGRIQIGSDIPVQIRDFSGNTVTQFYSTGIIVEVVPTLLTEPVADTTGSPRLDFIHLDVKVEKSAGRPSLQGVVIDRNDATTQVLLLNGEQTIIGGLYTNEESVSRRGVPLLKDLPWWFFGLRYVFGYTQTTTTQRELLIVLQADVRNSLPARANLPFEQDQIDQRRRKVRQVLERAGFEEEARRVPVPETNR